MPIVRISGVQLHFESDGSGPPIIALHGGLGFDHTYMRRGLAPLAQSNRLITPDLRCNGRSEAPIESLTMERLADDGADLLDELDIPVATILGHSYGGFVAQEFACRHPGRLARLVLVDTTPGQPGDGETPPEGPPQPEGLARLFSDPPSNDEAATAFVPKILPYYLHSMHLDAAMPFFEGSRMRVAPMLQGFAVLAAWSSVDRLNRINAPTLCLWGRHDVITSLPQSSRILQRIPRADLRVFEESGHFPFLEEPQRFFSELTTWLAGTD